jgi:ankyrin repeat protein
MAKRAWRLGGALAAAALLAVSAPVAAQQAHSDGYTFLKAVKERDSATVTSLVSEPGSIAINSRDRSSGEGALHYVVRDRDFSWLAFLLGKGARADLQSQPGNTPLSLAAQLGWLEGAELLLKRRASVDLPNARGETPLILAVQRRDLAMVRLLLANGANAKRTDSIAGLSALDYAARDSRAGAILKLLQAPTATAAKPAGPKL